MIFLLGFDIPIGVPPEMWNTYRSAIDEQAVQFTCLDGKKKISLSRINDNYPDCADGSDEPGTSASMSGDFYCKNEGSLPQRLKKWEVGDGICTCCDGTDELYASTNCPNTCAQFEKRRQELLSTISSGYDIGLTKAVKLRSEGSSQYATAKSKTAILKSQIKVLKAKLDQVQKARIYPPPTPTPTPEPYVPDETTEPYNDDYDDQRYRDPNDDAPYDEPQYYDYDQQDYVYDHEVDQPQDVEQTEQIDEQIEDPPVFDETEFEQIADDSNNVNDMRIDETEVHEMINEPPVQDNLESESAEEDVPIYYDTSATLYQPPTPEPTVAVPEDIPLPIENDSKFVWTMKRVWRFTFRIPANISRGDSITQGEQQKRIREINDKLREVRDKKRDLKKVAKFDGDLVFLMMKDKEFSSGKTTIKFLDRIDHDGNSIGNYKSVENDVLYHDGGRYCWQTSCGTKTELALQCWKEDKILSIAEVRTCEYKVVMATPAVCTQEKINGLNNQTLPQLEDLKRKLGI